MKRFVSWMSVCAVGLVAGCGGAEELRAEEHPLCDSSLALHEIVSNGYFETGPACGCGSATTSFVTLPAGDTRLTGWTLLDGGVDHIGSLWTPHSAPGSIDLNGGSPGRITQNLPTEPNKGYTLSFALAGNPGCGDAVKQVQVTIGTQSYTLNFDTTGKTFSNMGWSVVTLTFGATSTSTPLTFKSLSSGACGPALDSVSVTPF